MKEELKREGNKILKIFMSRPGHTGSNYNYFTDGYKSRQPEVEKLQNALEHILHECDNDLSGRAKSFIQQALKE